MTRSGDLRGHSFAGMDLRGALFSRADLYRADFTGARLSGAQFSGCFAAEAVFRQADCSNLRAEDSNFYRADFRGCNLRGAILRGCVLAGAEMHGARLRGVCVTLDCNSFEGVRLDRAQGAALALLFGRADSPQRVKWRWLADRPAGES